MGILYEHQNRREHKEALERQNRESQEFWEKFRQGLSMQVGPNGLEISDVDSNNNIEIIDTPINPEYNPINDPYAI